jgi:hypothetical protein
MLERRKASRGSLTMAETYRLTVDLQCGAEPRTVEAFAFGVLDELHQLAGITDADVAGSLQLGQVAFEFSVVADDVADAQLQAATLMRTALHAFGANTAGMAPVIEELQTTVRDARRTAACT